MEKLCKTCLLEKDINFFHFIKKTNNYRGECKECFNFKTRQWFNSKSEELKLKKKKWLEDNKDSYRLKCLEWKLSNKEKIDDINKRWVEKNRDIKNERQRKYDPIENLKHSLRQSLRRSLTNNGFYKKNTTQEILGCTFEEFKFYIESKFEDWMTWENRGLYNGELNYGWDIDHIIPLSSAICEDGVIKLNHYKNIQPLCSKVNRDIKKDKMDYEK